MSKVIPLNQVTKLDLPVDKILESTKGQLEGCVIIGFNKKGEPYAASSYADGGTVLWLLECCKKALFGSF